MRRSACALAGILLAAVLAAGPALADDHGHGRGDDDDDHDLARELYEHGDIQPLSKVLAEIAQRVPGDVVAIDLAESQDDRWIYVVQVVTADGRRIIVNVDAASGNILDQPGGGT